MFKLLKIFIFVLLPSFLYSQATEGYYRIFFTDKQNNDFSIESPEGFLTNKSINRRIKFNIPITETDLPVSKSYIDSLNSLGVTVVHKSKWFNYALIIANDQKLIDTIKTISFVKDIDSTFQLLTTNANKDILRANKNQLNQVYDNYLNYGKATTQIAMVNGHTLHIEGYKAKGVDIAVFDGGFYNVDILPAFDSLWYNNQIIGTKDFVDGDNMVFDASDHGTKVLSIMGGNIPGELIGTAPDANYWLIRTEQTASEFAIEEDNWVAAAEFADSVGVDIINSSLGYTEFDDSTQNHSYSDLDGNTILVSRAADMAASKGILVVNSAGNLGDDPWKYISAPADADSVLTVGAVDSFATLTYFSGIGPTSDGRVKPNVVAMGYRTALQGRDGNITFSNGTSFSTPIITGMAACLWQKYPELNNMQIIDKIEKSAHQYSNPDNELGYGVPDFGKAAELSNTNLVSVINNQALIKTYPNPFTNNLSIEILSKEYDRDFTIEMYNSVGVKIKEINASINSYKTIIQIGGLENFLPGIYYLKISIGEQCINRSISKIQ